MSTERKRLFSAPNAEECATTRSLSMAAVTRFSPRIEMKDTIPSLPDNVLSGTCYFFALPGLKAVQGTGCNNFALSEAPSIRPLSCG